MLRWSTSSRLIRQAHPPSGADLRQLGAGSSSQACLNDVCRTRGKCSKAPGTQKKKSLADGNISAGKVLTLRGADDFPVTGSHLVAKAKALFTVYCSRKDRAKQPIRPSCCATLGGRFTNPRTERRGFGGRCYPCSFAGSYDTLSSFARSGERYHPRSLATYANFVFAGV
jgi:hypothetical protein